MQSFNMSHEEQETNHNIQVKPIQPNHPINTSGTQTQRHSGGQRISQQIDLKNIGILILNKALIITFYFICADFKLLDFIFVTILISVDFWVNKNIYGKKLAGLRWWIELNQHSGQEEWIFESADPDIKINDINNAVFWFGNLTAAIFWLVNFIVMTIITNCLFWASLCVFCLGITLINLACFYRCRGNHQKKLQQIIQKVGLGSATNLISHAEHMNDQYKQQNKFQIQ